MNENDRNLPGDPSKTLIAKVRRSLKHYGINPTAWKGGVGSIWRETWKWADTVRCSYVSARPPWPSASEIRAQYVFLLLSHMRGESSLKLPYRGFSRITPAVLMILRDQPEMRAFDRFEAKLADMGEIRMIDYERGTSEVVAEAKVNLLEMMS